MCRGCGKWSTCQILHLQGEMKNPSQIFHHLLLLHLLPGKLRGSILLLVTLALIDWFNSTSCTVDEYDWYLSTPTELSLTNPFTFCQSQQQIYPHLLSMEIDILSIPAMLAGVERLFSQCKIILSDQRNRLQIDSLRTVECLKSWDKLQIGLTEIVDIGVQLEAVDDRVRQDRDKAEDKDMDVEIM